MILYPSLFLDPYFAPRIYEASWGMITASVIQLVASICSVYICIKIIYRSDSAPASSVSIIKVIPNLLLVRCILLSSIQCLTYMMKYQPRIQPDSVALCNPSKTRFNHSVKDPRTASRPLCPCAEPSPSTSPMRIPIQIRI